MVETDDEVVPVDSSDDDCFQMDELDEGGGRTNQMANPKLSKIIQARREAPLRSRPRAENSIERVASAPQCVDWSQATPVDTGGTASSNDNVTGMLVATNH